MVVCKFFQQGYCRYGQSCRFEHVYGNKYSYQAPQQSAPQQSAPSTNTVTDEQLLNVVHADVQSVLKSGQWLLSCYAPFKEKPLFPGFADLSPEEARLYFYEAKVKNTLNEAAAYMTQLAREAKDKYEKLLQVNPTLTKVLRSIYQGETVSNSPFVTPTQPASVFGSSNSTATSIFRSAAQSTSPFGQAQSNPTAFGQPGSVFGSPNAAKSIFAQANQTTIQTNQSPSVFGQPNTSPAKSIFAQANQNVFSNPTSPTNPSNIFSSANQNLFGQQSNVAQQQNSTPFAQNSSPFGQTPFSNMQTQSANAFASQSPFGQPPSQNVFAKPEQQTNNVFGVTNVFEQPKEALDIYSKMEDLSPEDLEAFKSDSFQLGFIPELPPPKELCV